MTQPLDHEGPALALGPEALSRLRQAEAALSSEVERLRAELDDAPEQWRTAEPGVAAEAWLRLLENGAAILDDLAHSPAPSKK